MHRTRIEDLKVIPRRHRGDTRWFREWCFLKVVARHFALRMVLLVSLLLLGGLLFMRFEPEKNHSLARASYYTFALVFGEPPEAFPESWVLRSLFFIVPIIGLTVIIEGLIDFAFMLRDRRRSERVWCNMLASSYRDHIVLVGFGRLGFQTYRLLRKLGEPVIVIERDADNQFLDELRRDGTPLLTGDARREALLDDANITKAKSIILATNDDLANLEIALDARRKKPAIRVVLRMFDQNMAEKIRDGFNIRLTMSQSAISAPAFAVAAIEPSIINTYTMDNQLIAMQRWLVRDAGPLCNKTVGEVMQEFGVGVAKKRTGDDDVSLFPLPDLVLKAGDRVIIQGPYDVVTNLQRRAMELAE